MTVYINIDIQNKNHFCD